MKSEIIKQEIKNLYTEINILQNKIWKLEDVLQETLVRESLQKEISDLEKIYKGEYLFKPSPEDLAKKEMFIRALRETLYTICGKGYKEPSILKKDVDPKPILKGQKEFKLTNYIYEEPS